MTERVHIRYTKWDGSLHWHFDADVVGRDRHGTWVLVPPGGTYRRGAEEPRTDEFGFVVLVPEGSWWTAYFNAVPRGVNGHLVYVDINTAATWSDGIATMIDLDLDVTLAPGSTARVIDQDEFDEHRVRYSYPPDVVDRVRTTAARVAADIDLGHEPFASAGPDRVVSVLGWAHGSIADRGPDGHIEVALSHSIVTTAPGPIPARVAIDGTVHDTTIEVESVVRMIAPGGAPIAPGSTVSVWVDPGHARFVVA